MALLCVVRRYLRINNEKRDEKKAEAMRQEEVQRQEKAQHKEREEDRLSENG